MAAEQLLLGQGPAEAGLLDAAADSAAADLSPPGDLHASGDCRRHLALVLVRRAITRAAAAGSG